jgi:hypothetical protein
MTRDISRGDEPMSFRTSVTIVASPRPRVGKTLAARLMTDFHLYEGRKAAGFDLNSGAHRLAQFLPAQVAEAAIDDIHGQMALFDALVADDDGPKIVDLGADKFEAFFALAEQFGFVEEACARGIAPAVLFVLTPDRTSIEAYRGLRRRFPRMAVAPVHNEMFGPTPPHDRYALSPNDPVVRLPMLAPALRRLIDTPPHSFAAVESADTPADAQAELRRWLRRIYHQFREFDLRLLLADLQSSIRFGA